MAGKTVMMLQRTRNFVTAVNPLRHTWNNLISSGCRQLSSSSSFTYSVFSPVNAKICATKVTNPLCCRKPSSLTHFTPSWRNQFPTSLVSVSRTLFTSQGRNGTLNSLSTNFLNPFAVYSVGNETAAVTATTIRMGWTTFVRRRQKSSILYRLHKKGPHRKFRPPRKPLDGKPMLKGVILKTLIKKPKKPNSANRKCVLVRLSNGKEAIAYVPGIGHNLQEHNVVLVRCGRLQDVPGVKLKCIRGKYDLPHVIKQQPK